MEKISLPALLLALGLNISDAGSAPIDLIPPNSRLSKETIEQLTKIGVLFGTNKLYRVDEILAEVISRHVKQIMKSGYAERLDANDFFHGHFLLADPKVCNIRQSEWPKFPDAMDKETWLGLYLKSSPHMLYHTREYLGPWYPYKGQPRSIMGTIDGRIYPAASKENIFFSHGSVSGTSPFEFNGKKYEGMCVGTTFKLTLGDESLRVVPGNFIIIEDGTGRYKLPNGPRFDVYYAVEKWHK